MNPTVRLIEQAYGKAGVRVTVGDHDLTLSIEVEGDFAAAYEGDNSKIVATDTMKNVAHIVAGEHGIASAESYIVCLAKFLIATYKQITKVTVCCEEIPWMPIDTGDSPCSNAFEQSTIRFTSMTVVERDVSTTLQAGFTNLKVMKTSRSGFAGFVKDKYTTLPETEKRRLATRIQASWPCTDVSADWQTVRRVAIAALRKQFADHDSASVQHSMALIAGAIFAACPLIVRLTLVLPNLHYNPVNLEAFDLANSHPVYSRTDAPYGNIRATFAPVPTVSA